MRCVRRLVRRGAIDVRFSPHGGHFRRPGPGPKFADGVEKLADGIGRVLADNNVLDY